MPPRQLEPCEHAPCIGMETSRRKQQPPGVCEDGSEHCAAWAAAGAGTEGSDFLEEECFFFDASAEGAGAKASVVEEERALKAVAAESMAKTAERCLFRIIMIYYLSFIRIRSKADVVFLEVTFLDAV